MPVWEPQGASGCDTHELHPCGNQNECEVSQGSLQRQSVLVQTGTARSQAVVMGGSGFSAPDSPSPTYEPVLPAGYVTPGVYPGEGQGGHGRSQEVPQEQAVGSGSKVDLSCQYVDAFVRVCGCVSVCVHMCHICCRNL